jgi:hypothetical protein
MLVPGTSHRLPQHSATATHALRQQRLSTAYNALRSTDCISLNTWHAAACQQSVTAHCPNTAPLLCQQLACMTTHTAAIPAPIPKLLDRESSSSADLPAAQTAAAASQQQNPTPRSRQGSPATPDPNLACCCCPNVPPLFLTTAATALQAGTP